MSLIATILIILSLLVIIGLLSWYVYIEQQHKKWLRSVFQLHDTSLLSEFESDKATKFKMKLKQAGITKKEFKEIVLASIGASLSLVYLIYILDLTPMTNFFIGVLAVSIVVLMPILYVDEQRKARIKRIDKDLAIFIDLLIIILEGGGGLNNAIDEVTVEGKSVLGDDLLAESRLFKYEFITYSSDVAYKNLAERTGSEAIATIVGFMKLSEETGIGVKTIFENQAHEIKSNDMLNVEKRAATMNIGITFTMFIFILPAIIAMVVFPMMADALMPKF